MPDSEYDFIILGQGLAGSILAHTLMTHGQKVLVLDNAHAGSSSQVAAGIINPITGHRLNISERFFECFTVAKDYYARLEKDTKQRFFREIKQTRLIKNQSQHDYLIKRSHDAQYEGLFSDSHSADFIDAEFGSIDISQTAVVDCKALLSATRQWLTVRGSYAQGKIDYTQIRVTERGVTLGEWRAKRMIFCEGYQAIYNPWLKHLPFKLAKGEILTIDITPTPPDKLLSWGNWLVPDAPNMREKRGHARLGSNFVWNDLTFTPSDKNKDKLLNSLEQQTGLVGSVRKHDVGIRPTTTHRKPFIGAISKLEHAYCFNGFGSKGCLLVPFYAELLVKHLLENAPLPQEVTQWI